MNTTANASAPDCATKVLSLMPEQKKQAIKTLQDLNIQLGFFLSLIAKDTAYPDDVNTHLNLFRHKFSDLSQILDNGMTISRELDDTMALLRDAHGRISMLEKQLGTETSCESAMAKLEAMERAFETWYSLCGFHYASTTYHSRGISADFSMEIETFDNEDERADVTFGDKELAKKALAVTPYVFQKDTWDITDNNGRFEIADTDSNRSNIKYLLADTFPGARITAFDSRPDHGTFRLKFTAFVPYADIDRWKSRIQEEAAKTENRADNKGQTNAQEGTA